MDETVSTIAAPRLHVHTSAEMDGGSSEIDIDVTLVYALDCAAAERDADSCNHSVSWFEILFLRKPDYAALRPMACVPQFTSRNSDCYEPFAFASVRQAGNRSPRGLLRCGGSVRLPSI